MLSRGKWPLWERIETLKLILITLLKITFRASADMLMHQWAHVLYLYNVILRLFWQV